MVSRSRSSCCILLFVVCCINFSYSANITIDTMANLTSDWRSSCSGYHEFEDFICDQEPLLPVDQYNGNRGYWAKCSTGFVLVCDIFYRPPSSTSWKQIFLEAYFAGTSVVEVVVESSTGFSTRFLSGPPGWQTVSVDLSSLGTLIEIKLAPEYRGLTSFAVIDKIIVDDQAPTPTTTTTPPSTVFTPSTVGPTGSTTVAPTTQPPTSTVPTTQAATTAGPTTQLPTTTVAIRLITIDTIEDTGGITLINECRNDYHSDEAFACAGSDPDPVIPSEDHRGGVGFWGGCRTSCSFIYNRQPPEFATRITFQAYHVDEATNSAIEISSSDVSIPALRGDHEWKEHRIDIAEFGNSSLIGQIRFRVVGRVVIDKIILEIGGHVSTTTTEDSTTVDTTTDETTPEETTPEETTPEETTPEETPEETTPEETTPEETTPEETPEETNAWKQDSDVN